MTVSVLPPSTADEELLLDLLNTTPIVDGVRRDHLADEEQGREWLITHGGTGTARELARVRRVRTVLQEIVRGRATPAVLGNFVASIRFRPTAAEDGLHWELKVPADHRLAARAVLAWDNLRVTATGRLRPCANEECCLYLIDHSKGNTGRWCSMAVCGNRIKVRRHYQRHRLTTID